MKMLIQHNELISQIKDLELSLFKIHVFKIKSLLLFIYIYILMVAVSFRIIYVWLLQNLSIDVHTYIDGLIASAATFIYLAGKKRFMSPYSYVLIHQIHNFLG